MDSQETVSRKPAIDGMVIVPTTNSNFIRTWLEVMRPFHHLTSKEMDFAAVMLEKRYEIASKIANPDKNQAMIDRLLFDDETKEAIRTKVGITKSHMQVILHKMRTSGVIEDKKFSENYIPTWTPGKPFRMAIIFKNENDG